MIETNNFSASRGQSQTCLNYAEAMPEIMSEANNFSASRVGTHGSCVRGPNGVDPSTSSGTEWE